MIPLPANNLLLEAVLTIPVRRPPDPKALVKVLSDVREIAQNQMGEWYGVEPLYFPEHSWDELNALHDIIETIDAAGIFPPEQEPETRL